MKIACIVLAAGRSQRFGENKLLKDLRGRTVIAHSLDAIPVERFARCVCVCSEEAVESEIKDCGFVPARYQGGALSESIHTGLTVTDDCDAWMFVNGDQPLLSKSSISALLDAFEKDTACVYRFAHDDIMGSPVIFPKQAYESLIALEGEQGGMYAARRIGMRIVPVQTECEAELWDVDDAAAFEKALDYLNS